MQECLFCKIIKGEVPSKKVHEDESVYAFEDINPQAPVHILIVPKRHVSSLNEIKLLTDQEVKSLLSCIADIAAQKNLLSGYRVVTNSGRGAGQSVDHLHFHLLGGRLFSWPPG